MVYLDLERLWQVLQPGRQRDRIFALDQLGLLLLIKVNSKEIKLIDEMKVSDADTLAHLAVSGDEHVIRELNALAVYRWHAPKK